jgi:hypothetical protein
MWREGLVRQRRAVTESAVPWQRASAEQPGRVRLWLELGAARPDRLVSHMGLDCPNGPERLGFRVT